ncbi:MAG TPA: AAA family ATPase [Clostridiales bacterium]|nr:AAA family ATPase [Clostridiales bacterium]
MNIKDAKEEIRNAIFAYFTKNEFDEYEIPIEKQRPIFLVGPPGIGKTTIMEQIAQELGVGLVSYSMGHHTRQSALGLPYIMRKNYGGREYSVTEYTMSEIIASVYDMIQDTGLKEGILFLDEINCVSETLAPAMLQFLQYKVFGRHRVPDGWIVVTAGNPPEYNNSVREFDIVTWDRLKRIDIEPDYDAWKEYAVNAGVCPAIITYLDIKRTNFYKIESTLEGKTFATARGWTDLSSVIRIYERRGFPVTENLVMQYIQNPEIAKDFAIYYDLFNKYRSDYQVERILDGDADVDIKTRAKKAKFDERLSLLGLLLDEMTVHLKRVCMEEDVISALIPLLKNVRQALTDDVADAVIALNEQISRNNAVIETGKRASTLSLDRLHVLTRVSGVLEEYKALFAASGAEYGKEAFSKIKADFDRRVAELKEQVKTVRDKMRNLYLFCDGTFGKSQEMIILETELTINQYASRFISRYGSEEYFAHNQDLLFYERQLEIINELENLGI